MRREGFVEFERQIVRVGEEGKSLRGDLVDPDPPAAPNAMVKAGGHTHTASTNANARNLAGHTSAANVAAIAIVLTHRVPGVETTAFRMPKRTNPTRNQSAVESYTLDD